jgi:DNA-binding NtrC family response regulator
MNDARVLVVDDEPMFVQAMVERLKNRGVSAVGRGSGEEALVYLKGNQVDVVVLDLMMKGMDGLEVLKSIRSEWPEVQTIMLTGHASVETGMAGIRAGAFDYLIKPAPLEDLIRKINQAIERKAVLSEKKTGPSESA